MGSAAIVPTLPQPLSVVHPNQLEMEALVGRVCALHGRTRAFVTDSSDLHSKMQSEVASQWTEIVLGFHM